MGGGGNGEDGNEKKDNADAVNLRTGLAISSVVQM